MPSSFSAVARNRLGRPRSTPCPIIAWSRNDGSDRRWARSPIKATFALPVAGSSNTPCKRSEHPRLKISAGLRVFDVQMNSGCLVPGQSFHEDVRPRLRATQRLPVADFGDDEWRPAACEAWRVALDLYIHRVERAGLGDERRVYIANCLESLGCGQGRPLYRAVDDFDRHPDQAGNFLEHHVLAIDTGAANRRLVSQHEGRADIRMSGERHLGAGRENAHAGGMRGIGRREDERGLGEVEFVGNSLHLRFGQATRVRDYRDGIAPELPIGEYVDGLEFHLRQWYFPRLVCLKEDKDSHIRNSRASNFRLLLDNDGL